MSVRPRVRRAGIVATDVQSGQVLTVIPFQYNPETLTRTLTASIETEGSGPGSGTRFTGVAGESIRFEAMLDAFDELFSGDATTARYGIHPLLASLERLVQPRSATLVDAQQLTQAGMLEVLSPLAPLLLLVWGDHRIQPVSITELAITEQLFDTALNPLRATVAITATVMGGAQLGATGHGAALALRHLQATEELARQAPSAVVTDLGVKL